MSSPVRYARSGDVNIAYQVTGDGPFDLVLVPGFFSHLEIDWEHPVHARFLERLGSFARLIRFDKRGTGLSDRGVGLPDFETRMDDVRAVMDAAGSERAALFGYSEGGPMSVLFAATYPERTRALVLYGTYAKRRDPDADYPWAPSWEARQATAADLERTWGENFDCSTLMPGADPAMEAWFQRRGRASLSPSGARDLILMNSVADVRDVLPSVQCPTLVLHRTNDLDSRVEEGRYIAEHIPGARFVELPGEMHVPWIDMDPIVDEVEEFLTGTRPAPATSRVLATILFTDLVGSTEHVRELGDAGWSSLLEAHHEAVRRELGRHGGREVDTAGDGFLALFDGPARAIRAAAEIRDALARLGLDVRAGVHTGEVEETAGRPAGIAVHLAARVLAAAGPGEVLVSQTTHDLVEGSGLAFEDRGAHELKGIAGARRLYALR
ncbi:MAG TPA: alpha/beta fold hydrolase [Gaiellaceae bacterium]|nr:alpha/beta fold hydrolase [Gaiellaceae bacterium]